MKPFLILAMLVPTAALAHPGDHGGLSVQAMIAHFAAEPDHVAVIFAVVAAGLALFYRSRARK